MTGPDGRLRALIAASGEKSAQALLALLPPEEYVSAVAQDGAEARRLLKAPGAAIVLVNAPWRTSPARAWRWKSAGREARGCCCW